MSTQAQIEANRENAKNSTGPTTPEGKQISSRNALRHGLTSKQLILPGENQFDYEVLELGTIQDWQPANIQEIILAKEIAQSYWKLQRVRRVEARLLDAAIQVEHADYSSRRETPTPLNATTADTFFIQAIQTNADVLKTVARYETTYERAWYRAINTLTKLQNLRRRREKENGFVQQEAQAAKQASTANGSVSQTKRRQTAPIGFVSQDAPQSTEPSAAKTAKPSTLPAAQAETEAATR